MTTPNVSSRRNSAATEVTFTDNTDNLAEKMASYSSRTDSFYDGTYNLRDQTIIVYELYHRGNANERTYIDEKTLSGLIIKGNSSKHSKTGLSEAMTKLKSKLKTKEEKPVKKSPVPSNYYPNARETFEAIAGMSCLELEEGVIQAKD